MSQGSGKAGADELASLICVEGLRLEPSWPAHPEFSVSWLKCADYNKVIWSVRGCACLFGVVRPAQDCSAAPVPPAVNAAMMPRHLPGIRDTPGLPNSIFVVRLLARCSELSPVENAFQFMCGSDLSKRASNA